MSGGRAFAALRERDFRLFWLSLLFSNAGTWLQVVAQNYVVYQLTHRALDLGIVNGVRAFALLTLPFLGGAVADRVDKRKLLLVTQSLFALSALALGVLVQSGRIQVWHVVAVSAFTAVVLAFDQPARQALLPHLVSRPALSNAIALNAVAFTGAGAIGPAIAGPAIALLGLSSAFYLNAASYLAVIAAVWIIRLPPREAKAHTHVLRELAEGVRYVAARPFILYLVALLVVFGLFALPYQTVLPVFADRIAPNDVVVYGLVQTMPGIGALAGGLLLAAVTGHDENPVRRGRVLFAVGAGLVFAAALAAFAFSVSLALVLPLLVVAGLAYALFQATVQTLLQHVTEDRMRGRVMSLFAVAIIGMWQVGAAPLGYATDREGAPLALAEAAGMAALLALVATFVARGAIRRLPGREGQKGVDPSPVRRGEG